MIERKAGEIKEYKLSSNTKPTKFLEISIIECLFLTLDQTNLDSVEVRVSGGNVRIHIKHINGFKQQIQEAIGNCYILRQLRLQKILTFESV